jgi:hypothetical protein
MRKTRAHSPSGYRLSWPRFFSLYGRLLGSVLKFLLLPPSFSAYSSSTVICCNIRRYTFSGADHSGRAWTVFTRSNTGIMGSNPTQSMKFCLCLFCGLATGWSPVQGVLLTVYRIKKLKKRPTSNKGLQSHRGGKNMSSGVEIISVIQSQSTSLHISMQKGNQRPRSQPLYSFINMQRFSLLKGGFA